MLNFIPTTILFVLFFGMAQRSFNVSFEHYRLYLDVGDAEIRAKEKRKSFAQKRLCGVYGVCALLMIGMLIYNAVALDYYYNDLYVYRIIQADTESNGCWKNFKEICRNLKSGLGMDQYYDYYTYPDGGIFLSPRQLTDISGSFLSGCQYVQNTGVAVFDENSSIIRDYPQRGKIEPINLIRCSDNLFVKIFNVDKIRADGHYKVIYSKESIVVDGISDLSGTYSFYKNAVLYDEETGEKIF